MRTSKYKTGSGNGRSVLSFFQNISKQIIAIVIGRNGIAKSSGNLKTLKIFKMNFKIKFALLFSSLASVFAFANINLPAVFTDNMVLQRNSQVVIWGNANPKEEITLKADFLDKEYKVTTGNDSTFKFVIPTGKEGGPYRISLKGYN